MPNAGKAVASSSRTGQGIGWSRREFLHAGLTGLAGLGVWGRLPSGSAAEPRRTPSARDTSASGKPNIILAMTDDQGWADVGYNGNKLIQTPTLDEMAAKGIRFNRFYAAAPVCSPTRGSCMTGRHPNRYGCFSWGYDLPLEEVTLAEALKAAGYATGHFGKWHLGGIPTVPGKRTRTNRGRRKHERPPHPGNQGFDEWFSYWNFFDVNPPAFHHNGQAVGPLKGDGSDITVDRAVRWIRKTVARKQPFLAVVWFGNPHSPHRALDKDKGRYPKLDTKQQNYLGEITAIDRAMSQLRKALRDLGVEHDTMLWFTSDNGGTRSANNGGLRGYKGSLWEGGVRVPGILEWPARAPRPFVTDVPACTSDYYPTILDLLDIDVPAQPKPIDGISLLPLIEGKMTRRPKPMAFEVRDGKGAVRWATLVDNRYKLHVSKAGKGSRGGPAGVRVYDLVKDPAEKNDLAAQRPKIAAAMKAQLQQWQASVQRSLAGEDYRPA